MLSHILIARAVHGWNVGILSVERTYSLYNYVGGIPVVVAKYLVLVPLVSFFFPVRCALCKESTVIWLDGSLYRYLALYLSDYLSA